MLNTMIIRRADYTDQQKISNLTFFENRVHRHLDWRSPLEWLGDPFYWVLEENGAITAALACPQEPDGIAWVRLFAFTGYWSSDRAWDSLWAVARDEISMSGGATLAAIATQGWFASTLHGGGFDNSQQIVLLEWRYQPWAGREADGVRIRPMIESDLPDVVRVDASAFESLWQNSAETLRKAFSQALVVTVAESERDILGYQLSTGNSRGAHLARLAVDPAEQGRGIGAALVSDLFQRAWQRGITRLTVNTQSDNYASLSLYQKMGFTRTGDQFPVYTYRVPPKDEVNL